MQARIKKILHELMNTAHSIEFIARRKCST